MAEANPATQNDNAFDARALDTLLSASVDVFGLRMEEDWQGDARFFLNIVAESARLILTVDLGDHAESASAYRA